MFLISKVRLYLLFIFMVAALLLFGINSYLAFSNLATGYDASLKFFVENFIFYVIIIVLILTAIFIATLINSRNIFKELDKVIELSRQGKYSGGKQLKKMGKLGDKIIDINSQLNSLNEMKSLKISSLSSTVNFLLEKSDLSVLILDAQGIITKISRFLEDQLDISDKDILNKFAENIFDTFSYSSVISELRKSKFVILKSPLTLDSLEKPLEVNLVVYPILNYKNEIANSICLLVTKDELDTLEQSGITQGMSPQLKKSDGKKDMRESQIFKRFTDIFR